MAIRSNDAKRASIQNQCDLADTSCQDDSKISNCLPQLARSAGTGRRHRLAKWLTTALGAGAIGLLMTVSPGCTMTSNAFGRLGDGHCIDDFMIGYRNRAMAEKAWHCQKHLFRTCQNPKEFKEGFIDGFLEVAEGGNGCVPSMAPKQFWGWRYQSAAGHGAVNAWFEGYPMGVRAAEQAGVGNFRQIQTAVPVAPQPQQEVIFESPGTLHNLPATHGHSIDTEVLPVPTETFPPPLDSHGGTLPFHFEPGDEGDSSDRVIELGLDTASDPSGQGPSGFTGEPFFGASSPEAGLSVLQDPQRVAQLSGPAAAEHRDEESDDQGNDGAGIDVEAIFGDSSPSHSDDSLPFSFE